ncbi:transporter [Oenococcus sicerae]|uniref:Transporter n=1 Tax=Oenococcus sicerae TaxID=2203724 RepID=A0ABX5QKP0_9LACO|nr:transporter [Oenococcus sicerae]QAS69333.1 transporter [Oenococcus sicerae]
MLDKRDTRPERNTKPVSFGFKAIFLNTFSGVLVVALNTVLQFLNRTFFIHFLGSTFLGYNGLFTNVLGTLSLAELGIGTAIIYSLYAPLQSRDEILIIRLMHLFKKIYQIIGISVLILGVAIFPFVNQQIQGQPTTMLEIRIVYFFFLLNSVSGYFFTYKRSLLDADQKNYKNQLNLLVFNTLSSLCQMLTLFLLKSFIAYAAVSVFFTVISNIAISFQVDKEYPYINKQISNYHLDPRTVSSIKKLTIGNFSNKVGTITAYSTDNILISMFVGIVQVGLYSNYSLIVATLQSLVSRLFSGLTSTIGLLKLDKSKSDFQIFKKIHFVNVVIALYIFSGLFMLINPFIAAWLGKKFLLSDAIIFLISFNLFLDVYRKTPLTFIDAYGLAWNQRWKSIIESALNLAMSFGLAFFFHLGIFGILLGTTFSVVVFVVWYEPYIVLKYGLGIKLKAILSSTIRDVIGVLFQFIILYLCKSTFVYKGLDDFLLYTTIAFFVPTVVCFLIFFRTEEYGYFAKICVSYLRRIHD